ncbi:peptidoglycan-binding protein [Streptomyces sp. NPDC057433]|uniref:peptidoglycan-binding protein n=1 Tax=Streptomyces sp. NPDC057433 TaxID=3346132 RepID=UPI00369AE83B
MNDNTGTELLPGEELPVGPEPGRAGLARRRRWLAGTAAASVLLTCVSVAAAQLIRSPAQAAAETAPPEADVLTAPVEHRVLKDTVVLRGTVRAGQTVDVAPQSAGADGAGAPVVTRVPVEAGRRVKAGQVVLEVSGRPVFVLPGGIPVYRDLKPGAEGRDVAQLQSALRGLGHDTGADAKDVFGAGTKSALADHYASIGYEPRQAGTGDADRPDAAQDAVRAAERALQDATSGQGGVLRERAEQDLADARAELAEAEAASGPMLPMDEVVFVHGFPAFVDSVTGSVGSRVSGSVLRLSAGEPIVHGYLRKHQRKLVNAGQKVQILSELTGERTGAAVVSVADAPASQKAPEGEAATGSDMPPAGSYRLVVKPDKALAAASAGQSLRLTIESASTEGRALVVPITAVSAGADSRTSVTVLEADGTRRRVEVRAGTQGDGHVAVVPVGGQGALRPGEHVIVGLRGTGGPR